MASEYPAEQDKEKPDLDIANEETAVWIAKDNSTGQNSHAEQTVSYGRSSEKPSEKRRKLYYEDPGFFPRRLMLGLPDAAVPHIHRHHDLAQKLNKILLMEEEYGDGHARFSLETTALSHLLRSELRRLGATQCSFAAKMRIHSGIFSTYFVVRQRKWSVCALMQRHAYYQAFLWLCLSEEDRLDTLYPGVVVHNTQQSEFTREQPEVSVLLSTVWSEMGRSGVSVMDLAQAILREPLESSQDILAITERCPDLTPARIKRLHAELWFWLRQTRNNRVSMLSYRIVVPEHDPYIRPPNLQWVCNHVVAFLNLAEVKLEDFCLKVMECKDSELLLHPVPWAQLTVDQRNAYMALLRWVSMPEKRRLLFCAKLKSADSKMNNKEEEDKGSSQPTNEDDVQSEAAPDDDLNPAKIAMDFQKLVHSGKAKVRDLLSPSRRRTRGTDEREQMDQLIAALNFPPPRTSVSPNQKDIYRRMKSCLDRADSDEKKTKEPFEMDTAKLANEMLSFMNKNVITRKRLSIALKVNRNLLSSILKQPVDIRDAAKGKKTVYQKCQKWMDLDPKHRLAFIKQECKKKEENEEEGEGEVEKTVASIMESFIETEVTEKGMISLPELAMQGKKTGKILHHETSSPSELCEQRRGTVLNELTSEVNNGGEASSQTLKVDTKTAVMDAVALVNSGYVTYDQLAQEANTDAKYLESLVKLPPIPWELAGEEQRRVYKACRDVSTMLPQRRRAHLQVKAAASAVNPHGPEEQPKHQQEGKTPGSNQLRAQFLDDQATELLVNGSVNALNGKKGTSFAGRMQAELLDLTKVAAKNSFDIVQRNEVTVPNPSSVLIQPYAQFTEKQAVEQGEAFEPNRSSSACNPTMLTRTLGLRKMSAESYFEINRDNEVKANIGAAHVAKKSK